MPLNLKLALALAAVGVLLARQTSAGFANWLKFKDSVQHDYDLLNNALLESVHEDGALANLKRALNLLLMYTGELESDTKLPLPRKAALVQFTGLLKLLDPEKPNCDMEALTLLRANEQATGAALMLPVELLGPLRRVESVIHEVAMDHAHICRHVHPRLFVVARRDAPRQIIRDIRAMMDALIATSDKLVFMPKDRPTDPRQTAALKARGVTMQGYDEAVALLMDMRRSSRDDPNNRFLSARPDPRRRNRWLVDEHKVAEMMQQYVYARCEYLGKAFDHILQPAEVDQQLYTRDNKYRAINDRTAELMIWLQYSRLCRHILEGKPALEKNVNKAIWAELL